MYGCFGRLYFVIECVNGGDLMFHMQRHRRLPEEHARFYSAEISLALNFLHERGEGTHMERKKNPIKSCSFGGH